MIIQQVRMAPLADGTIEVCIQRPGRRLYGVWHPGHEVTWHESWGLALAYVNSATAVLHGPQGTPPTSGTPEGDAEAMVEEREARAA